MGKSIGICVLALQIASIAASSTACAQTDRGLRFDSAGVLDLAQPQTFAAGVDVPTAPLDDAAAATIIAMPTLSQEQATLPFSDDAFACKPPATVCSSKHEAALLAASGGIAKRSGARLTAASANFVDWKLAESRTADGDGETHWYLGTLKGSGYARVEVQFEHDSPGSFLINPANGHAAFVHNGSDVVALSPDGARVVTFDADNAPTALRIAELDATGPTLSLQCAGKTDVANARLEFKGWRDAQTVDFALVTHGARNRLAQATAIRLAKSAAGWRVETANTDRLASIGFACQQIKP